MQSPVTAGEASRLIAEALRPLGEETVPLAAACGRVLREPLVADRPQPPFRRATMDGIAFASSTLTSNRVKLAGLHAAGDPPPRPIKAGEAWEIMTGAAVPDDCDSLVPYEEIEIASGHADITSEIVPGQFIHATGSDAEAGDLLVSPGAKIGPVELAIAASIGKCELRVSKLPVITILTTGDEVIPVDDTPQPWQIRRSNGPMLEALLLGLGFPQVTVQHSPDDETALATLVDEALATSDLVLLCGGISKGKRDHVRPVLESRLGSPVLHGVWQRPGKPLAFWAGKTPVFALPGNPVSVLATFTRYVRPALDLLQGNGPASPVGFPLAQPVRPLPKLTWLLPARLNEQGRAIPMPPQNSGDFISIARATHLLEISPGGETLPSGHPIPVYPLPNFNPMGLSHINESNQAAMVDVSGKTITVREATAEARITVNDAVAAQFNGTELVSKKGPVFQTAILAGVMGAKQTPSLIPLCHPLPLDNCKFDITFAGNEAVIRCTCKTTGKTGVEMEALTGASVASLAFFDMIKALDPAAVIHSIRVLQKTGGKSDFNAPTA